MDGERKWKERWRVFSRLNVKRKNKAESWQRNKIFWTTSQNANTWFLRLTCGTQHIVDRSFSYNLANLCKTFLGSNIGQNLDEVGIIAERIEGGLETVDGKDLLSLGEKDPDVASSDTTYSSDESGYRVFVGHYSCFLFCFLV